MSQDGFTYLELIIATIILAVLAAAIVPVSEVASKRAKEAELREARLVAVHAWTYVPPAPIAEPGLTVQVVAWVDRRDSTIRRIRLEGPFSPDEPAGIVRILELSRFDEPVDIEPPI